MRTVGVLEIESSICEDKQIEMLMLAKEWLVVFIDLGECIYQIYTPVTCAFYINVEQR
jgi:hypothetical protein